MAKEAPGRYAILEPWRSITRADGLKLGSKVRESLIEVLEEDISLVYYRQKPHADCMPEYTIVAKREGNGKGSSFEIGEKEVLGLDLVTMLIEGKIAECAVLEGQLVFLGNNLGVLGRYLSKQAETLDGLSPYFGNVPSTGKYLKQEIETLKKLDEARARLKEGNVRKKDLELFWVWK